MQNRGKQFETVIRESFLKVPNTYILRLHDQMNGYKGSTNICDFVVYKYPKLFLIECKSVHGDRFRLSNITDDQYEGLFCASKFWGVVAGVICWWIDNDITKFISADTLYDLRERGYKSIRFDSEVAKSVIISGKKKRVFFDYDMEAFLNGFY